MINLLRFLYEKRNFLFFLLLEVLCGWLIFSFNKYQGAFYFNSSNAVVGSVLASNRNFTSYFDLQEQNDKLVQENVSLRRMLQLEKMVRKIEPLTVADSLRRASFDFIPARLVKNSLTDTKNFITIDKGLDDGLTSYMGVVGPQGVVGEIKSCSKHFANGVSVLHVKNELSAKLSRSGAVGTVKWDGIDPRFAKLNNIGSHYSIQPGDSILTSGYTPIFPEGLLIGVVEKVTEENQSFNITVRLATDFGSLDHVYVIRSKRKPEIDSLEVNNKK